MLIEKSRLIQILNLSLPIVGGMMAQNLMGLIDTAMVGRLGDTALASLGVGHFLFLLPFSVLLGLSAGVQAMVARRIGEGHPHLTGLALNAGLLIATLLAILLCLLAYGTLPFLYTLITQDRETIRQGIPYLHTRIPTVLFIGANLVFGAYWNGISRPKLAMMTLALQLCFNVLFNYLLIFGHWGFPRLEAAGAGLGTTLATAVATLIHLALGLKYARNNGFLQGLPQKERIQALLRVAMPASVQQFFHFLGFILLVFIVGQLGTQKLAAYNVLINLMLIAILPSNGMGIASATLVGQALGRKEFQEAQQWGWEVARVSGGILILFGCFVILFPETILRLFIVETDTLALATFPLRLLGGCLWLESFGRVLHFSLTGAGATKVVLWITLLLQWCIRLPLHWFIGIHLGYGLDGIYLNNFFLFSGNALIFSLIWQRGHWAQTKI